MLSNESIASIAVLEDPRRIYVLTDEDRVWFGDGKTDKWELAASRGCDPLRPETQDCDLTSTLYGKGRITNLVADKSNRVLYAATTARLIGILDDSTHSWSVRFIPETELHESIGQIAVTGGNEPLLYVSVKGRGGASLYQSRDKGEHWNLIKASQLPRAGFRRLVPDPTSVDRLYIASPTGAIRTIRGSSKSRSLPPRTGKYGRINAEVTLWQCKCNYLPRHLRRVRPSKRSMG